MALKVYWTPAAERSFETILDFILEKWTEKEVKNFVKATQKTIELFTNNPELFVSSKRKNIRKAIVTKYNSLYYRIKKESVELLIFWDNRKNPEYNTYK